MVDMLIETILSYCGRFGKDLSGQENHEPYKIAILKHMISNLEAYENLVTEWALSDKISLEDQIRWYDFAKKFSSQLPR